MFFARSYEYGFRTPNGNHSLELVANCWVSSVLEKCMGESTLTRTIDEILKEMDDSHAQFSEPSRTEHPLLTSALRRAVERLKQIKDNFPDPSICSEELAAHALAEVTRILNGATQ
jgi:hypothetical protein